MIMNTGDEVFLQNITPDSGAKIYNRIPRMTFDLEGMSIPNDQLSSIHNLGHFTDYNPAIDAKSEKVSNYRRIPIQFGLSCQIVFNNIFELFGFVEILLMTTYKNNVFSFYYLDKFCQGSYSYQDNINDEVNKALGFDADKRTRTLPLSFTVELQFPAFDYYNSMSLFDATNAIQTCIYRVHPNGVFNIATSEQTETPQALD